MVKRFVERFQLWMRDVTDEFEDKCLSWLLFVAILMVGVDAYTFFTTHHFSLDSILGTVLFVAFVVLYVRKARWTWIPLMVLALRFLAYIPFDRWLISKPDHTAAKIFAVAFVLILAGASFAFSLTLRKRFANSTRTI